MSPDRLVVRASPAVFEDLDRQLGRERGPDGEPSVNDFQALDLLEIVDRFAVGFFKLPPLIPDRPDHRVLVLTGMLVRGLTVVGQRTSDGAVELISLEIDP